jgi:hypothetical protein
MCSAEREFAFPYQRISACKEKRTQPERARSFSFFQASTTVLVLRLGQYG